MEVDLNDSVLVPVLALILWSLIVWVWMYALRLPAMQKAGIRPDDARSPGSLDVLPLSVRQVADNYNHLMEQPTIFYALAFFTVLAGHDGGLAVTLAWAYVILRVIHSLIQNTINRVTLRFLVFSLGSIVLIVWAVREAMTTF
ncbi:MAG TPA: MAPEG family protein [Caulobacteraceae bacterium]|nr:MAPEG family protein [Caulobacteraceae bacterium]